MGEDLIEIAKQEIEEKYKKSVIISIKFRLQSIADKEREINIMKEELIELNTMAYEAAVRKYGLNYERM